MNTEPRNTDLAERLQFAVAVAREAGAITLEHFRSELAVEYKADASPVTVADRAAETALRERIAKAYPDDAILGEEFGSRPGTSGLRWILDPIDGTKSFIHGVPLYGTLIGLEQQAPTGPQAPVEQQGRGILGVIHIPALGETVYAARGQGAWYQRGQQPVQATRVSNCPSLAAGLFCTSEARTFREAGRAAAYDRLQAAARLTRTWGDCYGYLLVATGRCEVMVDAKMSLWDAAAIEPIMVEAGGTFTDFSGRPTIHSGEGIATNGRVLEEVLQLVAG